MSLTRARNPTKRGGGHARTAARVLLCALFTLLLATGCSFGDDGPTTADRNDTPTPEVLEKTVTSNDPASGPTPTAVAIVIEGNQPGNIYVVQPGDLLGVIANELEVTAEALAEANGITDPNSITVGQELIIPEKPEETSDPEGP